MTQSNKTDPILFPVDEAAEERMRGESRYIEFTDVDNQKTRFLVDRNWTRVIFAERETPGVTWDIDPNYTSVKPMLTQLRNAIDKLILTTR